MCTVVVLGAEDGSFILAGNRDELWTRGRADPPRAEQVDGVTVLAPRDPDAGGTWTAATSLGLAFSLLNDYGRPYEPPDPVSRGLLIPALVGCRSLQEVEQRLLDPSTIAVHRMRAFSLRIAAQTPSGPAALLAHWDGLSLDLRPWPLPALAVSSGWDVAEATQHRSASLAPLLRPGGDVDLDGVKQRFSDHGTGRGRMSVCMHGGISNTVSHTQIHVSHTEVRMRYYEGSPCQSAAPLIELRTDRGVPE